MSAIAFDVDPVHTFLGFGVRYLGISRVHGRFTRFRGMLEIDWDDLTRSSAHLMIDTDSIETGSPERDAHLRSPDFLDVARFPEMVFHGRELRQRSGAVYELGGTLQLHGVARPVTLEAEYGGQASDLNGIRRVGVLARGTIDRREFGLGWNRPLEGGVLVGWDVALDLSVQGVRAG
ncbi:MAG TPA: YceI family protein [Anaeromyxobacter sp.]